MKFLVICEMCGWEKTGVRGQINLLFNKYDPVRGDVGTFVTFRQDLQDLQDIFLLFFSFPDEREKDNPPIGGGYSAFMRHNGGLILIVFPFTATSLIRVRLYNSIIVCLY